MSDVHREQATLTVSNRPGTLADEPIIDRQDLSVANVDPLTAYLATSPGGSDSIAIIAASTDCDVSFVMAMQTVRMIAVLLLAPVLTKFIAERLTAP